MLSPQNKETKAISQNRDTPIVYVIGLLQASIIAMVLRLQVAASHRNVPQIPKRQHGLFIDPNVAWTPTSTKLEAAQGGKTSKPGCSGCVTISQEQGTPKAEFI